MRTDPPQSWQPLVDSSTEGRRRKWVLGVSAVAVLLGGAMIAVVVALALWETDPPEGYTLDDVCWVDEGEPQKDDALVVTEVSCGDDHQYVSGQSADTADDCPVTSVGSLDDEDGRVICLERPR